MGGRVCVVVVHPDRRRERAGEARHELDVAILCRHKHDVLAERHVRDAPRRGERAGALANVLADDGELDLLGLEGGRGVEGPDARDFGAAADALARERFREIKRGQGAGVVEVESGGIEGPGAEGGGTCMWFTRDVVFVIVDGLIKADLRCSPNSVFRSNDVGHGAPR